MMVMKITKPTIFPMTCFLNVNNVYYAATELEPLSAPQATFEHDDYTFSNCSLLHKLLITGQGEQVESRRGELDRYLLSTTCDIKYPRMTVSMVSCRLEIKILDTYWSKIT